MIDVVLAFILAWLVLALFGIATGQARIGTPVLYACSLLVALVLLVTRTAAIPAAE